LTTVQALSATCKTVYPLKGNLWRRHFVMYEKSRGEGANCSVHFGRFILALRVFAKQQMQAQVEAPHNFSVLYI
jgi:hypothetical protein